MGKVESEAEAIYDKLGRGAATDVKTIRDALLAAEKRGREEAAKIAESYGLNLMQISVMGLPASPRPSEARDVAVALKEIAAAIRSGQ